MSYIPLLISIGFFLTISSAIDPASPPEDSSLSSSSTTANPPLASSSTPSTSLPRTSTSASAAWSKQQQQQPGQSGPINFYKFAQAPSYNFRSPLPSSATSSFASLMSNLFSPFNKVMSRRAAGGKLFSLAEQFNPNNLVNNGNNNNLGGLEYPGSAGNLEALNEAVSNVMLGLNSMQPNQANQLAGQLGSYLTMASGDGSTAKNGKKLFDIPKQWYKMLGEKISGASEAAYSATVPLKESFMHTLKSFYSYIKPSRSQSASPFADATNMVAAAAAAAAGQESLLAQINAIGQSNGNQNNNPKRRQSDSYGGYYYNNLNGKMASQPKLQKQQQDAAQQMIPPNQAKSQFGPQAIGRYNHGAYYPHHQGYVGKPVQPQQPQQLPTQQTRPQQSAPVKIPAGTMMTGESQAHPAISVGKHSYYQYLAKQPAPITPPQPQQQQQQKQQSDVAQSQPPPKSSNNSPVKSSYDQIMSQMIQAQIQQGQQQLNMNQMKHPNALYQKSKEIISRFTKKKPMFQPPGPQYGYASNAIPLVDDYAMQQYSPMSGHQHQQQQQKQPHHYQPQQPPQHPQPARLPSQTVAKVVNKLPTLPLVYNANNNQLMSQQQQHHQTQKTIQQQQQQQPQQQTAPKSTKTNTAYYTQQPANQNPFGIQPVYPPQPQVSGTTSISSTLSPMMTSTSVSMSMHQSMSSSYDEGHDGQMDPQPQHIQFHPGNLDQLKQYEDNNGHDNGQDNNGDISVQNNQGSVVYYYDNPALRPEHQAQPGSSEQQSSSSSSSSSQSSSQDEGDESQQQKKRK